MGAGLIIGLAYFYGDRAWFGDDIIKVTINPGLTVYAEVVDTPDERAIGLSEHTSLDENEAMLFIFKESGKHGFWMKDMDFAIDIIWLNKEKEIVHIKENADPANFPESYAPDEDAQYVLELVSGLAASEGIEEGQVMEWD